MNHTQKGFSIIEISISILLTAFVIGAVVQIYQYISKSSSLVSQKMTNETEIVVCTDRLKKDVLGIVPLWFTPDSSNPTKTESINADQIKCPYLFGTSHNNNLELITFISSNGLKNYPINRSVMQRIAYRLEPKKNSNLFLLQRAELAITSDYIVMQAVKNAEYFTIVDNIESCLFEYGFYDKTDTSNNINWSDHWGNQEHNEKQSSEKKSNVLPDCIKITLKQKTIQQSTQHIIYIQIPHNGKIHLQSFASNRYYNDRNNKQTQDKNQQSEGKEGSNNATP